MSFELCRGLSRQASTSNQRKSSEYDLNHPCHIDSLHDELLARILLLLRWDDRLGRVERVSRRWRRVVIERGWSDLTVFDNQQWDYSSELPRKMRHLFSRCGPRLSELALQTSHVRSALPQSLMSCPNVRHLRLSLVLDDEAVDCIRETLGGNLRSLAFENCFRDPETIPALNNLFAACPQLEYLYISEGSEGFSLAASSIRLPPQLKCLALYDGSRQFIQRLLSEENVMALPPNLRALRLYQYLNPAPFPRLVQLVNLTYLGVAVTKINGPSLLAALPAMPGLRALELKRVEPGVIDDFPALCTQIEHLALSILASNERQELKLLRQVALRLEYLRSLRVYEHRRSLGSIDCRWLETVVAKGRLEYLHAAFSVDETTGKRPEVWPLPIEIVRNCKDLYALYIDAWCACRPGNVIPDYEGIVNAAKEVEAEWMKSSDTRPTATPPTIRIGGMREPTDESVTSYRRIEWIGVSELGWPAMSATLHRYQYGMLSAGAPTLLGHSGHTL